MTFGEGSQSADELKMLPVPFLRILGIAVSLIWRRESARYGGANSRKSRRLTYCQYANCVFIARFASESQADKLVIDVSSGYLRSVRPQVAATKGSQ